MRWTALAEPGCGGGEVETLQQAQDLQHRHPAGTRRPHAAYPVLSVVEAHRRPLTGAVTGEIGEGEGSRIDRIATHGSDDLGRDGSFVEGVCSLAGNGPHRLGVGYGFTNVSPARFGTPSG